MTVFETSAASGTRAGGLVGRGDAGGDETARDGGVDAEEEVEDVTATAVPALAAVEAVGDGTGLLGRGWVGALAVASSSKVAVALALCGGSNSAPGSVAGAAGVPTGVGMLSVPGVLSAVGVLGLLWFPALFRRMRSTSDGRAFNVGRRPSIQDPSE